MPPLTRLNAAPLLHETPKEPKAPNLATQDLKPEDPKQLNSKFPKPSTAKSRNSLGLGFRALKPEPFLSQDLPFAPLEPYRPI